MFSQYVNLYFPVCSFVTVILLCVLFFSKEKVENEENTIYSKLLRISFIEAFVMFFTNVLVCIMFKEEYYFIFEILNKILYSIYIIWITTMFLYVYKIGNNTKFKLVNLITFIFNIVLIVLIFVSPIKLYYDDFLTNSSGTAADILYFGCTFYLIWMIILFIYNFKNVKEKKKYLPMFLLLLLMTIMMIIRKADPLFNISSNVLSFVALVMYFTIENPDLKLVRQLEHAKNHAEKASNAKTDFLSSMSHEIRTPLNAIIGFSEELKNEKDKESRDKDIDDIIMAGQNLLEIVNGILDINKIESGNMEVVNDTYKPKELFDDIVKLISPRLNKKELKFISDYNDLPFELKGDKEKIREITLNLLTNAIKYTEKGKIDFKVSVKNKANKATLFIEVIDTGRGIKQENMSKLFTKFNRLESDRNTTLEGTGLGLAITKNLVDMLDGKIEVISEYGKGSTFTVKLPQEIVSLNDNTNDDTKKEENKENLVKDDYSNKKILLVDDNNLNIKVATRFLGKYNINPDTCMSGKECIEKINSGNEYDLILMDDMMPEMSGTETCNKLKESGVKIPIVVLTANAVKGQREEYLSKGFDEYLSKPINQDELSRILKLFVSKEK